MSGIEAGICEHCRHRQKLTIALLMAEPEPYIHQGVQVTKNNRLRQCTHTGSSTAVHSNVVCPAPDMSNRRFEYRGGAG